LSKFPGVLETWSKAKQFVPLADRNVLIGMDQFDREVRWKGYSTVSSYWLGHHKENQGRESNDRRQWIEYAEYLLSGRAVVKADVRSAIMAMDGYGDRKLANRLRKLTENI